MSVRDGLTKKTAVLLDFDQITLQTSLTNVIGLVTSHSHFCQGDGYQFFNWQVCILDALMVSKYNENCFIWLFFLVQPHSSVNRVIEVMNVSLGLGLVKSSLGNILIMSCRQIVRLYISFTQF